MADIDKEVFVNDDQEPELIEVKKKGRRPMSEARKTQLREQLKKAREAKKKAKAEREAEGLPPIKKDPKASKVIKVLDQVGETPEPLPPVYVKSMKKNQSKDIEFLKMEIAELKKGGTSKADLQMIKELKEELTELRNIAKEYKKRQKDLNTPKPKKEKPPVVEETQVEEPVSVPAPAPVQAPVPVAPRYSTYKKSIWTQFT